MKVKFIAAIDAKRGIARQGQTPWHIPSDLARFRELTEGGVVVMGRKTFEAIGRALPGRRNIVASRQLDYQAEGIEVVHDVLEVFSYDVPELWIIGGEEIFKQTIDQADVLELTKVDGDYGCDRFFPPYEQEFILTNSSLPRHENSLTFVFSTYTRK